MIKRTKIFLPVNGLVLAIVLNVATWYLLYDQMPRTGDWVVLQYNVYTGISVTGQWQQIFYLAASGSVVCVLNAAGGWFFYKSHQILSYFLSYSAVLVQLILLLASGLIIYYNRI